MGKIFSLAFKNAFRQKKRSVTLGVNYAVVTLLLLLVLSFSNGVRATIGNTLVRGTAGHLTISGEYVSEKRVLIGVQAYERITRTVKDLFPDSTVVKRYNFSSALYYRGISKRLSFIGVDAAVDQSFTGQLSFAAGSWEAFLAAPNAVIVPRSVAEYYGLSNGEEVLISRRTRLGAFNTGTLKIAGIHDTGNFFLSELVLCHFDFLQDLDLTPAYRDRFNAAGRETATTLFVYFKDPSNLTAERDLLVNALNARGFEASGPKTSNDAISAVTAASPRYTVADRDPNIIRLTVSTLDEVLGIVGTVLAVVNGIGIFITLILLFIIAVSIFINLRMTINERLEEIGTMRAMGVEAGSVTRLFILENTVLALFFSLIGTAVSLLLMGALTLFVRFPAAGQIGVILDAGKLVLVPTVPDVLLVVGLVTAFAALFSFFPARYGGRIKPVDALSSTY
ncbi:MAG: ABC transporter permease [Spirochaetales bacterium]|nr:ABC transporter permease [Spirochaetales bacterium]